MTLKLKKGRTIPVKREIGTFIKLNIRLFPKHKPPFFAGKTHPPFLFICTKL